MSTKKTEEKKGMSTGGAVALGILGTAALGGLAYMLARSMAKAEASQGEDTLSINWNPVNRVAGAPVSTGAGEAPASYVLTPVQAQRVH